MIQYSRSVRFNDLPCPGLIARVQTYMRAVPSPDPHQTALTCIQPHEDTKLHTGYRYERERIHGWGLM